MSYVKELKLKARISNIEEMRQRVKKIATPVRKEEVVDYFFKSKLKPHPEMRLRRLENDKLVTLKIPFSKENGMQENNEYKFSVGHADEFVSFLEKVGFKPCCMQHKSSEIYAHDDVEIEIASIKEVGDFIELKMHTKENNTEEYKKKLKQLAQQLGIAETFMDARYYCELLQEVEKSR
jgi:predicted adenylyl cyclase CyaB